MEGVDTINNVVVHPLVLLSAVDHYNRVARDTRKRVVGVLLGKKDEGGVVDVSNSFAVPFEEDPRDKSILFLDHNYLEEMFTMFKKVNIKEKIVGFYSTGPKLRQGDLALDRLFRKYCAEPVLVIVDVRPDVEGLPIQSYRTMEVVHEGKETVREFKHIPCEVGAAEVEEIGVEHLLRDVNDPSVTKLGEELRRKIMALRGLTDKLKHISKYLQQVVDGDIPVNNEIVYNMQKIINLLPNLSVESLVEAMNIKTNDMYLVVYISSLVRSVLALHDLVVNKLRFKDEEGLELESKQPIEKESAKSAERGEESKGKEEKGQK